MLTVDVASILQAGQAIRALSQDLSAATHEAARILGQVESHVGDRELAVELQRLDRELARAGYQAMRAVGVFGDQVQIASHTYQQADQELASIVDFEAR